MPVRSESLLSPGERLDRYQLVLPLAAGGMAEVWLARLRGKRGFERLFAVKTVLAELSKSPRVQRTFVTEARIAAAIRHPNVAEIIDVGEHRGHLYLVLEYVEGGSLSQLRRKLADAGEAFPLGVALRVASDVSRGLHAAHTLRGDSGTAVPVVHRDVSPQNVLVGRAGGVKLIDFGIAKAVHTAAEETGVGMVAGKVWYMAPEQALSGGVDARTDVWGVGAVLHHLLAGHPPYISSSEGEAMAALCSGESPPRLTTVPDVVSEVLARSLAYEPRDRYSSAHELHIALESAIAVTVGAAPASEVAALVERVLRAELEDMRTRIASALSSIEHSAPEPEASLRPAPVAAPEAAEAAPPRPPPQSLAGLPGWTPRADPKPRGSLVWVGVAVGCMVFALGVLLSFVRSRPEAPALDPAPVQALAEPGAEAVPTAEVERPIVVVGGAAAEPEPVGPDAKVVAPSSRRVAVPPKKPAQPKSVIDVLGETRK